MPDRSLSGALRNIRQLLDPWAYGEMSDGQLLERFAGHRDEAAFEAMLHRHGAKVLEQCRGMLRNTHAAEDAFQATFFVLARRASTIRKQQSVCQLAVWRRLPRLPKGQGRRSPTAAA